MEKLFYFAQVLERDDLNLPNTNLTQASVRDVLGVVAAILGFVSIIVIIIAGIKFMTSQGNPQQVSNARNTIIYAAIGLVVSVMAYSIVTFVLDGVS